MSTTLVARGVFRPDGLIELLDPVEFPSEPQEVTVTLTEPVANEPSEAPRITTRTEREPSGFWPDESISAPFDLPRPPGKPVHTVPGGERLPDPVFLEIAGAP